MKLAREPACNSTRTSFVAGNVPNSVKQPSECRLDEEALSRMDDEGGASDAPVNPPGTARKARPGG